MGAPAKRSARAALTSAPPTPKPAPAAAPAAEPPTAPTPRPRMVEDLDGAVRAALARGDHVAHAALSELHVAAGLLKAKAATRGTDLTGTDAELAKRVYALL